ncbi:DUF3263 domain-containing protein [Microbacterium sp. KNMS]
MSPPTLPRPTAAQLLAFEAAWGVEHTGRKDEAIRAQLGITPARFYVLLNRLIDTPDGNTHDPVLCRQLRDLRAQREAEHRTRLHQRKDTP